jgi:hypothetical protein
VGLEQRAADGDQSAAFALATGAYEAGEEGAAKSWGDLAIQLGRSAIDLTNLAFEAGDYATARTWAEQAATSATPAELYEIAESAFEFGDSDSATRLWAAAHEAGFPGGEFLFETHAGCGEEVEIPVELLPAAWQSLASAAVWLADGLVLSDCLGTVSIGPEGDLEGIPADVLGWAIEISAPVGGDFRGGLSDSDTEIVKSYIWESIDIMGTFWFE